MSRTFPDREGALSELTASPAQRRAALYVCAALFAGAAAALAFASSSGPVSSSFLPACFAVVCFAGLATAGFLRFQFSLTGSAPLLALAAAYLYSSGIALAQLLTLPASLPPPAAAPADSDTTLWLWAFRQIGFPLLILVYALLLRLQARPGARRARRIGPPIAGTALALATAVAGSCWYAATREWLPGASAAALPLDIAALLALYRFSDGGKSFLHLWLLVGVFASALDSALTLVSAVPFTVGWYFARIASLVSSAVILCLFVYEMNRLYMRLVRRERELSLANEKLRVLSLVDGLTGVANRRRFDDALAEALVRGSERRSPVALLMLDIDEFKRYNDRYGHVAGDEVIRRVAATAEALVRIPDDVVARYGGEEFAVLLPDTDPSGAMAVAERIRAAVERLAMPHAPSGHGVVTVSIGAAATEPGRPAMHPRALIERADAALYMAKRAGRNRVMEG